MQKNTFSGMILTLVIASSVSLTSCSTSSTDSKTVSVQSKNSETAIETSQTNYDSNTVTKQQRKRKVNAVTKAS